MKKVSNLIWGVVACIFATTSLQAQSVKVEWEAAGPDNVSGRSRAILVDNQNSSIIYAGSAGGGLYISQNGGMTWQKAINLEAACVNALIQDSEGNLYVGTGEGLNQGASAPGVKSAFGTYQSGYNVNYFGIRGNGVYKMVNDSFVLLEATADWKEVNRMAFDEKNNTLYAATDDGLQYSQDFGETWSQAKAGSPLNLTGIDVKACNGVVVFADLDRKNHVSKAYISTTGPNGFTSLCGKDKLSDNAFRIELALAPSDSSYIYASAVNTSGDIINMYMSKDQGKTFQIILPGGSVLIDLYSTQGFFTNSLAVFPSDPEHLLIGGYPYVWEAQSIQENGYFSFTELISNFGTHNIVFTDKNIYFATNVGIYKSEYLGTTLLSYVALQRNITTAQITDVSVAHDGALLAGSTNNGSLYISTHGNTDESATSLLGAAYAGSSLFSILNTNAMFYATTYGFCYRRASSSTEPELPGSWYDEDMMLTSLGSTKYPSWSSAIMKENCHSNGSLSPMAIWETTDDQYATEVVTFVADKRYDQGDSICVKSKTADYPMWMPAPKDMDTDDTTRDKSCDVIDRVQSRLFIGGGGFFSSNKVYGAPIFMAKGALNFAVPPTWYRIFFTIDTNEQVTNLCVSEDGNHLYASTFSASTGFHNIYRISGFNTARDSATLSFGTSMGSRIVPNPSYGLEWAKIYETNTDFITSIALDPYDEDNNKLIITFSSGDIQMTKNAAEASDNSELVMESKLGSGLPFDAAFYTALVLKCDADNSNNTVNEDMAMIGTEEGVYYTENFTSANPTWTLINTGINSKVPVVKLIQQRNMLEDVESHYYSKSYIKDSAVIDTVIIQYEGVYNHGWVYAATYGRGIFRTDAFGAKGTGIDRHSEVAAIEKQLHIYPNPTDGQTVVEYDLDKDASSVSVSIYDVNGRRISYRNIGSRYKGTNQVSINCSSMAKGIYFVQVRTDEQVINGKVVVK